MKNTQVAGAAPGAGPFSPRRLPLGIGWNYWLYDPFSNTIQLVG